MYFPYYYNDGSFNDKKNAEKIVNKLVNKGYSAEIINNNPTKFRVSVGGFDKVEDAIAEYKKYVEKSKNKDVWLLRNK